jgi:hypothetical protein
MRGSGAARAAAFRARGLIAQGIDPLTERAEAKKAARPVPTFADIAALVVAEAQKRTTNLKVAYQWGATLALPTARRCLSAP